jgi:hypothetical protein
MFNEERRVLSLLCLLYVLKHLLALSHNSLQLMLQFQALIHEMVELTLLIHHLEAFLASTGNLTRYLHCLTPWALQAVQGTPQFTQQHER